MFKARPETTRTRWPLRQPYLLAADPAAGPRVVHVNRDLYDVYIGRAVPRRGFPESSPFANPFRVNIDGSRAEVITRYRLWLLAQPHLVARLPELRGLVLGCWCAPAACHGDVLLELANA